MHMFFSFLLVINLFVFNYAGDSNEDSDEDACKEYYEAVDEAIFKMIEEKKMPACWDDKWNDMQDEEKGIEMDETEFDKFSECLKEVMVRMEDKPVPDEKCAEVMKKQSSSDDSSEENSDDDSSEES